MNSVKISHKILKSLQIFNHPDIKNNKRFQVNPLPNLFL